MKKLLFSTAFTLFSLGIFAQKSDDEAIKKACIAQTEAFFKRDLAAVNAINADVPYASRYWANNAYNGSTSIQVAYANYIKNSPQPVKTAIERANWQLKAMGDAFYWATYDQVSTFPDGKVTHSKEARLLEKMDGQWKIVSNITIHMPTK